MKPASTSSRLYLLSFAALLFAPASPRAQQINTAPVLTAAPQQAPAAEPAKPADPPPAPPFTPTAAPGQAAAVNADRPPIQAPSTYVIGLEDSLEVTVWKEPTLSGTLPVRPDGFITIPLIGDVLARGLTPVQLAADIATRLRKFINDPNVTVTVLAVNSKHIYMIGEVAKVGPIPYNPGMSPLQAIASAGGVSQLANQKKIYILRTVQGKQQKIPFDYKKAVKTGDMQGVVLQPDDNIVVP